ncbi:MAG: hypothetical protein KME45_25770 [Stenomitos rutilans HA7619-LM2]|nr:hypothetical protein [Stenomitos rutilans HA7619-LM2]
MLLRSLGFTIASLLLATSVSAQTLSLPSRTTGLTPLKGQVTAVQAVRIPLGDAITGSETRVTLKFALQGCLDKLMPLMSHADVQGDRVTFYVTALNAHTEGSMVARCRAMPQTTAQVKVPGIFQRRQIRVVFLGQPTQPQQALRNRPIAR